MLIVTSASVSNAKGLIRLKESEDNLKIIEKKFKIQHASYLPPQSPYKQLNDNRDNQTSVMTTDMVEDPNTKFIILDSKLVYVVVAVMISFIIVCMLLTVFRR